MRQGPYELQIIGRNGVTYAEEEFDEKNYIRAREGETYKVKVRIHCDPLGHFPFPHAKVRVRLDGAKLTYGKRLNAHDTEGTTFRGFRKDEDSLRSFVFAVATPSTPSENNPSSTNMGTIEVTIFEAEETDKVGVSRIAIDKGPQNLGVQEDKKFWQQASLGTARGNEIHGPIDTTPKCKWKKLRHNPDATLVLHYHTPEMIDFLKNMHLQKAASSAPHVPIGPPVHIDLSTHLDEAPVVPIPAPVIDLMQDAPVRVKRENASVQLGREVHKSAHVVRHPVVPRRCRSWI